MLFSKKLALAPSPNHVQTIKRDLGSVQFVSFFDFGNIDKYFSLKLFENVFEFKAIIISPYHLFQNLSYDKLRLLYTSVRVIEFAPQCAWVRASPALEASLT